MNSTLNLIGLFVLAGLAVHSCGKGLDELSHPGRALNDFEKAQTAYYQAASLSEDIDKVRSRAIALDKSIAGLEADNAALEKRVAAWEAKSMGKQAVAPR